jgi:ABC-2 type transport system permease protein
MFVILYVIFTYVFDVGKGVPHYPVYLLLGIVLWNFFTETTVIGMSAVVGKGDLIRKINIPRYLTVLSTSASALINLAINLVVVLVFALINGIMPMWSWLLFPVIIAELFVFSVSLAFLLAALYVKFRDITYIWEVGLQAAFYATPILYPLTKVEEKYREYFFFNPMAQIIQDARAVFVTRESITIWDVGGHFMVALPIVTVLTLAVVSHLYFKRQAKWFAENI